MVEWSEYSRGAGRNLVYLGCILPHMHGMGEWRRGRHWGKTVSIVFSYSVLATAWVTSKL